MISSCEFLKSMYRIYVRLKRPYLLCVLASEKDVVNFPGGGAAHELTWIEGAPHPNNLRWVASCSIHTLPGDGTHNNSNKANYVQTKKLLYAFKKASSHLLRWEEYSTEPWGIKNTPYCWTNIFNFLMREPGMIKCRMRLSTATPVNN